MFEDEGTEIESTSDVTPETSSESQVESQPEQQAAAPQESKPEEQRIPYERFQEMVAHKNEALQKMQAYESQMAQLQRQLQDMQRPKSTQPDFKEVSQKMQERLKGIDPEFQSYMGLLEQQALSARDELKQFREEQFVNKAVSKFEELNKTNGVTPEVARLYRAELDAAYQQGKIRTVADLENAYKSIHEPFNKMLAAREQAALAKYTEAKKAAATKPAAQPKGRAAAPGQAQRTTANPQDRRATLISETLTQLRAGKPEAM